MKFTGHVSKGKKIMAQLNSQISIFENLVYLLNSNSYNTQVIAIWGIVKIKGQVIVRKYEVW